MMFEARSNETPSLSALTYHCYASGMSLGYASSEFQMSGMHNCEDQASTIRIWHSRNGEMFAPTRNPPLLLPSLFPAHTTHGFTTFAAHLNPGARARNLNSINGREWGVGCRI